MHRRPVPTPPSSARPGFPFAEPSSTVLPVRRNCYDNRMKTALIAITAIAALAIFGVVLFLNACEDDWCAVFDWQKAKLVTDFDSCARFGFRVMESYPEQCAAGGKTYRRDIGNVMDKIDLILITRPRPGDTVSSPLAVEGEARGMWFFEASFPVFILDANGNELGVVPADAQGEWMTESFVPFRAVLEFRASPTERGTLLLKKDNPSGLPEHDDELRVPVWFGRPPR